MQEKLKPCPFCDGVTALDHILIGERTWWFVRCLHCGEKSMLAIDAEEAVRVWNRSVEGRTVNEV